MRKDGEQGNDRIDHTIKAYTLQMQLYRESIEQKQLPQPTIYTELI